MILKHETNTIKRLKDIMNDLRSHIRTKDERKNLLESRIQERLNKSLQLYYSQLTNVFDKLTLYNETHDLKLIKKLNKD